MMGNEERKLKLKKYDLELAKTGGWANKNMRVEEVKQKEEERMKKLEVQRKWQDIWNGEQEIKLLRDSIEGPKRQQRNIESRSSQVYRTSSQPPTKPVFVTGEIDENIIELKNSKTKNGYRSIKKLKY